MFGLANGAAPFTRCADASVQVAEVDSPLIASLNPYGPAGRRGRNRAVGRRSGAGVSADQPADEGDLSDAEIEASDSAGDEPSQSTRRSRPTRTPTPKPDNENENGNDNESRPTSTPTRTRRPPARRHRGPSPRRPRRRWSRRPSGRCPHPGRSAVSRSPSTASGSAAAGAPSTGRCASTDGRRPSTRGA